MLILAVAALLALTGCLGATSDEPASPNGPTNTGTESPNETDYPVPASEWIEENVGSLREPSAYRVNSNMTMYVRRFDDTTYLNVTGTVDASEKKAVYRSNFGSDTLGYFSDVYVDGSELVERRNGLSGISPHCRIDKSPRTRDSPDWENVDRYRQLSKLFRSSEVLNARRDELRGVDVYVVEAELEGANNKTESWMSAVTASTGDTKSEFIVDSDLLRQEMTESMRSREPQQGVFRISREDGRLINATLAFGNSMDSAGIGIKTDFRTRNVSKISRPKSLKTNTTDEAFGFENPNVTIEYEIRSWGEYHLRSHNIHLKQDDGVWKGEIEGALYGCSFGQTEFTLSSDGEEALRELEKTLESVGIPKDEFNTSDISEVCRTTYEETAVHHSIEYNVGSKKIDAHKSQKCAWEVNREGETYIDPARRTKRDVETAIVIRDVKEAIGNQTEVDSRILG